METQEIQESQKKPEQSKSCWRHHPPWFQMSGEFSRTTTGDLWLAKMNERIEAKDASALSLDDSPVHLSIVYSSVSMVPRWSLQTVMNAYLSQEVLIYNCIL